MSNKAERRERYLRKRHEYYAGAAAFWGQCLVTLQAGDTERLKAIFQGKLAERLADADRIEGFITADVVLQPKDVV